MSLMNSKQANAANAMQEAKAWLEEHGLLYRHLPPHQLKIGSINFWPGTGTITIDGEPGKRPANGLAGLEEILLAGNALPANAKSVSAMAARSRLRLLGC